MTGYKSNSNKSVAFLYSKDKQAEKEIREMKPFTIVTNNITYLGVTLTKQVKDLYDKNFKSLEKISEDGKFSHAQGLTGLIYSKWPSYQKQYTDSLQSLSKFQLSY